MTKAIDKLRQIANSSTDMHLRFAIERWINDHVVEVGNSFSYSQEISSRSEVIRYHSERALMDLAMGVVKAGCEETERPLQMPAWENQTAPEQATSLTRVIERKICIIKNN